MWANLRGTIKTICGKCHVYQICKKETKKYGHVPEKQAEGDPWEILCVDLIGPYKLKMKDKTKLTLWCVTMINPAIS